MLTMFSAVPLLLPLALCSSTYTAATTTINLATVTPSGDGTSSATTVVPFSCSDDCFDNTTRAGEGGCPSSGAYECLCAFPAVMQNFHTCLTSTCALADNALQETLSQVQQVCGLWNGYTPNGGTAGGGSTPSLQAAPTAGAAPGGVCWTGTVVSASSSLLPPPGGGAVGTGLFSAGTVACAATSVSAPTGGLSSVPAVPLPDGGASSGGGTGARTSGTSAAASNRIRLRSGWGLVFSSTRPGSEKYQSTYVVHKLVGWTSGAKLSWSQCWMASRFSSDSCALKAGNPDV
ncbi:hypothetical protein C8R46DRAFT_1283391 [Mycena filopes]|nr:hypothetical protein C8R46DRAFT_1283391 [Mycena filopes]